MCQPNQACGEQARPGKRLTIAFRRSMFIFATKRQRLSVSVAAYIPVTTLGERPLRRWTNIYQAELPARWLLD